MNVRPGLLLSIGLLAAGCSESRRTPGGTSTPRPADSGVGQVCCSMNGQSVLRSDTCAVGEVRLAIEQCAGLDASEVPDGGDAPDGGEVARDGDLPGTDGAVALDARDSDDAGDPSADGAAGDAGPHTPEAGEPDAGLDLDGSGADVFAPQRDASTADAARADAAPARDGGGPPAALRVTLTWNTNLTDLDLHLVRDGGAAFSTPDDCYYANLTPDWGTPGVTTDDPDFELDDLDGLGPEVLSIEAPAAGSYQVYVHLFSASLGGNTTATVDVELGGSSAGQAVRTIVCNDLWLAGTITWTGSSGTFTPATTVTVDTHGTCP